MTAEKLFWALNVALFAVRNMLTSLSRSDEL
jgi:hypothetical protein